MPEIIDDKSEHCIPFILDRIKEHQHLYRDRHEKPPPFFVGLNGVQGAGKTTLVGSLSYVSISTVHGRQSSLLCPPVASDILDAEAKR